MASDGDTDKTSHLLEKIMTSMMQISWTEKVPNKKVLSRMKIKKRLFTTIQIRKLKYFEHINRRSSMQTTLLNDRVNGRIGRGRPRTSKSGQRRATSRLFVCKATDMTGGSLHSTLQEGKT